MSPVDATLAVCGVLAAWIVVGLIPVVWLWGLHGPPQHPWAVVHVLASWPLILYDVAESWLAERD